MGGLGGFQCLRFIRIPRLRPGAQAACLAKKKQRVESFLCFQCQGTVAHQCAGPGSCRAQVLMKLTSVSESGRTLRRSTMFAGFILLAVSGLHLLASFSFNTCTWLVDGILLGLSPGASVGAQVAVAVVLLSVLRMFLPGALLHATIFVGYDSRGRRGRGGCLPAILSTPFVYLAQLSVALLSGIDILATVLDLDETRPDAKCDSTWSTDSILSLALIVSGSLALYISWGNGCGRSVGLVDSYESDVDGPNPVRDNDGVSKRDYNRWDRSGNLSAGMSAEAGDLSTVERAFELSPTQRRLLGIGVDSSRTSPFRDSHRSRDADDTDGEAVLRSAKQWQEDRALIQR
eukprot:INCI19051.3.p1 GENE.INCI19051.3~~INCI19051.3.p1  ORF type:complete len:346 (+),score=38.84 INCI19051.3:739-1776(+)